MIIPAYNEEGRVGIVVRKTLATGTDYAAVVIDDASSDRTAKEATDAGARVIRHRVRTGVGGAIKTGYKLFKQEKGDVAVVVNADGQHDPFEIPAFLRALLDDDCDYVVGNRFSRRELNMPKFRRFGNMVLTFLTRLVVGFDVKDSQMGFTAITREGLSKINLLYLTDGWGFPNDMLIECSIKRIKVKFILASWSYGGRRSYIKLPPYIIRLGLVLARGWIRKILFSILDFAANISAAQRGCNPKILEESGLILEGPTDHRVGSMRHLRP